MKSAPEQPSFRRAVTPWGSFAWGYSDVGADIFVGLGLVLGAAAGASNIAFLFAGLVYVCVGLAYTELAAAYPVAGGGQYFVLRGLGDIFGFIAGWAVLLDFTIDIVLFAWSCIDYLSKLLPFLAFTVHPWTHFAVVFLVIAGLAILNVIGVRESSAFNEVVSGARRRQRNGDPLLRFPLRVPAGDSAPYDEPQLADDVQPDERHVARHHLVRRSGIDLAGRSGNAASGVGDSADVDQLDPHHSDLRALLFESGARDAALDADPASTRTGTRKLFGSIWATRKTTARPSACWPR